MKDLQYAGGNLVMSDAGADAVILYAEALALSDSSGIAEIPVVRDGEREVARIVLGPASQLFASTSRQTEQDLDDSAAIVRIAAATRLLGPSRAEPVAETELDETIPGLLH